MLKRESYSTASLNTGIISQMMLPIVTICKVHAATELKANENKV
jgi:hypothetical protein